MCEKTKCQVGNRVVYNLPISLGGLICVCIHERPFVVSLNHFKCSDLPCWLVRRFLTGTESFEFKIKAAVCSNEVSVQDYVHSVCWT